MAYTMPDCERPVSKKPKNIRSHNRKIVLDLFRQNEDLSILDICSAVNLSKTSVIKIIASLSEDGLVLSKGKGKSTAEGGKPPELFCLNREYAYIVSVIPNTKSIVGTIFNLHMENLRSFKISINPNLSYSDTVTTMADVIRDALSRQGIEPAKVCGVSVGCEGIINPDTGILLHPVHHVWGEMLPLKKDLEDALGIGCPVFLENICRNLGYAELAARGNSLPGSTAIIYAEESIGGCIVQNGKILSGPNGLIGEVGHVIIDPNSRIKCSCGNTGCFEALASSRNLVAAAIADYSPDTATVLVDKIENQSLQALDIFDAANAGDAYARAQLINTARYFSVLIHNIILMHDVQTVIIQGVYSLAGEFFLTALNEMISAYSFHKVHHQLDVVYSVLPSSENIFDFTMVAGAFTVANAYFANQID